MGSALRLDIRLFERCIGLMELVQFGRVLRIELAGTFSFCSPAIDQVATPEWPVPWRRRVRAILRGTLKFNGQEEQIASCRVSYGYV